MNTPEIGSKWILDGLQCEVTSIHKRGRGYQVVVRKEGYPDELGFIERLRDFLKAAKPL